MYACFWMGGILVVRNKPRYKSTNYPVSSFWNPNYNDIKWLHIWYYGIYNSARLVSVNNGLRKHIQICLANGTATLNWTGGNGEETRKTVSEIVRSHNILERDKVAEVRNDETELRKYLDQVINEVKKDRPS